jgi:serine phosphatase RsbU (regulator of sigma subunit)
LYVLFTDGVHEAYSESGEEFGLERVRETIGRHLNLVDADVPAAIVADLQHFIAPAAPADDICIVTFEVTSNAKPASSLASERMTAT